ncbi:Glucose 1-dehydrogenase 2 [Kingella potus]|uniref:Glucose 1-dehydrogenase 2 n=1 Tax=Kingella potus TaxID=265175 RepID=A0A377R0U4_9NEIS|nr:SDR family oxidoreductase [Kingella potus]UOP00445.1 SDR family oxidoreductase [Kingella potus]STR02490.1 Glucose 1-dehydrogenase 2 [Kingella potus]
MKQQVTVVLGSGAIAVAIARRVSTGNHVLLADLREENAEKAAQTLREAGFECSTMAVDVSDRAAVQEASDRAAALGEVRYVVHSAGVSPSQAAAQTVCKVDLYGTALVLEIFGGVIAEGGSGVVIGSQSSHRLPPLAEADLRALAVTPTEELLDLPLVKAIDDTLYAYQIAKKANALRVQMEAVRWGRRGARVNCISPGIIYTPLALDELNGERQDFYRDMLANLPAKRGGTPDEVAALAETVLTGGYITGSDFLIDGGATAKFWWGEEA